MLKKFQIFQSHFFLNWSSTIFSLGCFNTSFLIIPDFSVFCRSSLFPLNLVQNFQIQFKSLSFPYFRYHVNTEIFINMGKIPHLQSLQSKWYHKTYSKTKGFLNFYFQEEIKTIHWNKVLYYKSRSFFPPPPTILEM